MWGTAMDDQTDLFASEVRDVPLAQALSERYLSYALATIKARSLPDVRDGLKPVQRRLLHAMRELGLDPGAGFKKCARIVGDVMGRYHPHGDQAIYDAMVRLAQDFSVRYPTVEGQGNFGNVDGDNPAAMRYTEARLTPYAFALLEGIDEDAVDFRPSYDGSEAEPSVLPASVPNLLCNGAAGIAVGMATNIPPHNLDEVCAAALHLLRHPDASIAALVDLMPGPDFPTGGVLAESRATIEEAYAIGRGVFRLRARWSVETVKGGKRRIVVTEIPYQVQKSRLIERIADLIVQRRVPMLADVRDESAEDVRILLEPRSRSVELALLMAQLFRHTELENRVPVNLNVLDGGLVPRVMNLRQVLQAFLDHRHDVLVRRTRHRLGKIAQRLEVLAGYLIAYADLDEIIRVIRETNDPKAELMRRWSMSDRQAESILNMRLRALHRLEAVAIESEHGKLGALRADLEDLLSRSDRRWSRIAEEIEAVRERFGAKTPSGARRTAIEDAPVKADACLEAAVARESITIVCSEKGWIRSVRGHLDDSGELKFKDGDCQRFLVHAETTDRVLAFGTNGRFYTLACGKLPGGRGHGEPIRLMIDLGNDEDLVALFVHRPDAKLLLASTDGRGFLVSENAVLAQTRAGRQVLNPSEGNGARLCVRAEGDAVAVVGTNRKMIVFPIGELPEMARGRGVILQRYADGGFADAAVFDSGRGLVWQSGGRKRTLTAFEPWRGKRGGVGRPVPRGFPRANRFR